MKVIDSIDALVTSFGGPSELGRLLQISQEAVSMWKTRGEIPRGWHMALLIEAHSRGWRIDPAVFGLSGAWAEEFARIERAEPAQATEARPRL